MDNLDTHSLAAFILLYFVDNLQNYVKIIQNEALLFFVLRAMLGMALRALEFYGD
jgi:hypothetical protein